MRRRCQMLRQKGEHPMNEDRMAGTARNVGGKAEEDVGRTIGDVRTQVAGISNQVKGAAQDLYGQARDRAGDVADTARDAGSSFESAIRNWIEQQPHTSVAVALGLGWLLGRMHRPL